VSTCSQVVTQLGNDAADEHGVVVRHTDAGKLPPVSPRNVAM